MNPDRHTASAPGDALTITDAQREVRTTFMGGFPGHLATGAVWLISAGLATWVSRRAGILGLVAGGMFLFPLTQVLLRLMGRPASLPKGHPMNALARQTAFIVPLCMPLIAAVALYRIEWFYPAFMIVVGAHYLPFSHLYGMWQYEALGATLIAAGLAIALWAPIFSLGGWIAGMLFLCYAFVARSTARRLDGITAGRPA